MQNNYILASLRTKRKIKQEEFANILGISYRTYKDYESGLSPITLECLNTISNYYNVSLDYLLGLTKNPACSKFQDEIDYSYLRFSILYFRKMARLNQKKLAKEFGVSIHSISTYERDGHLVSVDYLYKIAQKFKFSADYICGKSIRKEVL